MKSKDVSEFFNVPENYLHKDFGVKIRAGIIRELLGDASGKKILDIGCGDGRISLQYQHSNLITLADQSQEMLKKARQFVDNKYESNVRILNSSLESFIGTPGSFDIIICMGLLAHLENWEEAILKISSIASSGAKIAIQISDSGRWLTRWQLAPRGNRAHLLNSITWNSLNESCSKAGLTLTAYRRFGFMLPGMGRLPNDFLFRYTRYTATSPLFHRINTDVIAIFEKSK